MLAKEGATSSDEISSLSPQNYENRCESHMSWADIDAHHQTAYSTHMMHTVYDFVNFTLNLKYFPFIDFVEISCSGSLLMWLKLVSEILKKILSYFTLFRCAF